MTTTQLQALDLITERLIVILQNNPSMDKSQAIELAFKQDQNFITEMLEQKTERSKTAKNQICKNVYGLINILN